MKEVALHAAPYEMMTVTAPVYFPIVCLGRGTTAHQAGGTFNELNSHPSGYSRMPLRQRSSNWKNYVALMRAPT